MMLHLPFTPLVAAPASPPTPPPAAVPRSEAEALQMMFRQIAERLAAANRLPELTGSGPYPARMETDLALPEATIYRPADLGQLGTQKLGLLIWGNGACTDGGASARAHLAEIASHGYLVIAPGQPNEPAAGHRRRAQANGDEHEHRRSSCRARLVAGREQAGWQSIFSSDRSPSRRRSGPQLRRDAGDPARRGSACQDRHHPQCGILPVLLDNPPL